MRPIVGCTRENAVLVPPCAVPVKVGVVDDNVAAKKLVFVLGAQQEPPPCGTLLPRVPLVATTDPLEPEIDGVLTDPAGVYAGRLAVSSVVDWLSVHTAPTEVNATPQPVDEFVSRFAAEAFNVSKPAATRPRMSMTANCPPGQAPLAGEPIATQ